MGLALLALVVAAAQAAPSPRPSSSPSPRASASPSPAAKASARHRLDLGPYAAPGGGTPKPEETTAPRFESEIEVHGKGPLPDPNETMAVWWQHFDFTSQAIYGYGSAFGIQAPPGSVNLLPLVQVAADKVKDAKRNRAARRALASPSPSPEPSSSPTSP